MPHRYEHYAPAQHMPNGTHCVLCHEESQAQHAAADGTVLQRLEHLEHLTHHTLLPVRQAWGADEGHGGTTSRAVAPALERTLWQGRPALLASACSLVSAALWTGIWGLALRQSQAVAAMLGYWHVQIQEWLIRARAWAWLWWYAQGTAWLNTPALAEDVIAVALLTCTLGACGLLVYRLRRAACTGYCLTTQRLRSRRSGQWTDVDLADLDRVRLRRPFWGRLLGYGHIQFRGRAPMLRRVHWWGVPQRAMLIALLQATLRQAGMARRHSI